MKKNNIEWGREITRADSDVAGLVEDVGIPGVGLVARFIQHLYDTQLQGRFEKFISDAEVSEQLLSKISENEIYSNCFYGILETARQAHSGAGLIALALIYEERWNDETYLIAAVQAFSRVSGITVNVSIPLYESIPEDKNHLALRIQKGDESHFHNLCDEAAELIRRDFFVTSTGAGMHSNGPTRGVKWDHTDSYYVYCKLIKDRV